MKTRYLVYIVRADRVEYVNVAGVFYGFSRDPQYPLQLNDWQADYNNFYGKSSFKSLKEIQKFHGHSKVEKAIKTGAARSQEEISDLRREISELQANIHPGQITNTTTFSGAR